MAGLVRAREQLSRSSGSAGRTAPTARPAIQPYARTPVRFDTSCTRAAAPMIAAGSIAITAGLSGLLWVVVQVLLRGVT